MTAGFSNAIRSLGAPARVIGVLLLALSLSRLLLVAWYWDRASVFDGIWFILLQGVRFDIVLMGMLLGPALLAAPWLSGRKTAGLWLRVYLVVVTMFIFWIEMGTIPYIDQYDARPNYIYVEYLKYPREVLSMLLVSYGMLMAATALVTLAAGLLVWRLTRSATRSLSHQRSIGALLLTPLLAVLVFAMIRSTLDHHPQRLLLGKAQDSGGHVFSICR